MKMLDSLRLELQTMVSYSVDDGNRTQALWKSSQGSQLLSHLSRLERNFLVSGCSFHLALLPASTQWTVTQGAGMKIKRELEVSVLKIPGRENAERES